MRKIFGSIGIIISLIVIYIFSSFFMFFDNNFSKYTVIVFFVLIAVILNLTVWIKTRRKLFSVLAVAISLALIVYVIYYRFFSMYVEPLRYLKNKYGFKTSEITVMETIKSKPGFLFSGPSFRGAVIEFNGIQFRVHQTFHDGWVDDYEKKLNIKRNYTDVNEKLNSIIELYSSEYKIINNKDWSEYKYTIFLHTSDENMLNNIVNKADSFISEYYDRDAFINDRVYIIYRLYIIKDKELYNSIANSDISDTYFKGSPEKSFTQMTNLKTNRIAFYGFHKPPLSIQNDVEEYRQIVFCYDSQPNGSDYAIFSVS